MRANWAAIRRRRAARARWRASITIASAAAVVALAATWSARPPIAPETVGPALAGSTAAGAIVRGPVDLADGSRIEPDEGSVLEVLVSDDANLRLWLREGSASFDVVPGGGRRWTIEAGRTTVEVLGTSFRVARSHEATRVTVTRGSVLVRSPDLHDGLARLHAGEDLLVRAAEAPSPLPPAARVDETLPAAEREPSDGATPHVTRAARDDEPTSGRAVGRPASDALGAADDLRATGRVEEAVELLLDAARMAPDDPNAGIAAFTAARLQLDHLARPSAAASTLHLALERGLPEPLREDALARLVECYARTHDEAAAADAAARYLASYPDGRRRNEVERWAVPR